MYVSQRDKAKEALLENNAHDVVTSVLTYPRTTSIRPGSPPTR